MICLRVSRKIELTSDGKSLRCGGSVGLGALGDHSGLWAVSGVDVGGHGGVHDWLGWVNSWGRSGGAVDVVRCLSGGDEPEDGEEGLNRLHVDGRTIVVLLTKVG